MINIITYAPFIKEIKDIIYKHQYVAMKQVNIALMELYWSIGAEIDKKQKEKGWGKSVVEILSKELQKEFPGVQGLSSSNLWRMKNFYIEYTSNVEMIQVMNKIENIVHVDDNKDKGNTQQHESEQNINLVPIGRDLDHLQLIG